MTTNELLLILFFILFGGEIGLAYGLGTIFSLINKQEETDNSSRPKIGFQEQLKLEEDGSD